jgi:hypothetical protein
VQELLVLGGANKQGTAACSFIIYVPAMNNRVHLRYVSGVFPVTSIMVCVSSLFFVCVVFDDVDTVGPVYSESLSMLCIAFNPLGRCNIERGVI